MNLNYTILDPTGNITALVETPTGLSDQPDTAAEIMSLHPEVEQVGFVDFTSETPSLRMAGGEFCGNASMSAAVLYVTRKGNYEELRAAAEDEKAHVLLTVSGAVAPVKIALSECPDGGFNTEIQMPAALAVNDKEFSFGNTKGSLPVVSMEGISHIVIEEASPFFELKKDKAAAEKAVRLFCEKLEAPALGLMFLESTPVILTPLVYVHGGGTVFWENSCASGSCAVGEYMARKNAAPVDLILCEPGGILRVQCAGSGAGCALFGSVKIRS